MNVQEQHRKRVRRVRRALSVRAAMRHAGRPRLSVHRSVKHISAQVIDDAQGRTLAAASSLEKTMRQARPEGSAAGGAKRPTKSQLSAIVGETVAKRALEKGVAEVVFDRGALRYHGRVKALADAARKAGLRF
jgi:large subunit ribosomal protein L18